MTLRIGVDVGGTKIESVLLDGREVVESNRVPTHASSDADSVINNIVSCARSVWRDGVESVGVALPGLVVDGVCTFNPNISCLVGVPIAERLSKELDVPVALANDANCFALAEHRLGAGEGSMNMIGVIVGTGLGGGLILNGELFTGSSGGAGEIGHMRLPDGNEWEDIVPGPGIKKRYLAAGGDNSSVSDIMSATDGIAKDVRDETYALLGRFLASLINAFNPDCIVLGGGVSKSLVLDEVREVTREYCVPGSFEACRIERFAIADSAGAIGASFLSD